MSVAPGAGGMEFALFLCEYGAFAAGAVAGPVTFLTGASISFRRIELERLQGLLAQGHWETVLFERWAAQGKRLLLAEGTVEFRNSMTLREILRQRFTYGRRYAAVRRRGRGLLARAAYAAFCLVLPGLLCARTARVALQRRFFARFLRALPFVLLFHSVWSAGEMAGYLFGAPERNEIY